MTRQRKVAVIVGSLRKGSNSLKIARAIAAEAPKGLDFEVVEIGDLPFYNQDLDADPAAVPAPWTRFRAAITASDAVLFVTPEYNRSIPAAIKNAIDVGSRPYGKASLAGKPAAIVSSSLGPIGGFGANHHLRQSISFLDMPTLAQPEMYLGSVGDWFDDEGGIKSADTRAFLAKFAKTFAAWIEKQAPAATASKAA